MAGRLTAPLLARPSSCSRLLTSSEWAASFQFRRPQRLSILGRQAAPLSAAQPPAPAPTGSGQLATGPSESLPKGQWPCVSQSRLSLLRQRRCLAAQSGRPGRGSANQPAGIGSCPTKRTRRRLPGRQAQPDHPQHSPTSGRPHCSLLVPSPPGA
eukprot:scaffold14203_cov47-Prasinocladus_malaysianus.AAC.4